MCSQTCWKSLIGIFFLFLSLGGFAIELQDQHHHYSYSVEDIDEIEDEESNEEDWRWNPGHFVLGSQFLDVHLSNSIFNGAISRFISDGSQYRSGKDRCILFHQLKWDSAV